MRELDAALHRALVLTPGETLSAADFPWIEESPLLTPASAGNRSPATGPPTGGPPAVGRNPLGEGASGAASLRPVPDGVDPASFDEAIAALERDWIERALAESGGRIREAARRLGLARNTLKGRMARFGLRGSDDAGP